MSSVSHGTQSDDGACGTAPASECPPHYGDPEAEYAALSQRAGLADLGPRARVQLAGRDAAVFLNRFATNKLDDLAPGTGRETFLTDAKGHVLWWAAVLQRPECLLLDTDAGHAPAVIAHLDFYRIREEVEFHDVSGGHRQFLLAGPHAAAMFEKVTGQTPPRRPLDHADAAAAGHNLSVCRVDLGHRPAFLLSCPAAAADMVRGAITAAGARQCGGLAWEAVRIEAGWPSCGRDVTRENLPQELARDGRTISFRKGCYLGQETVARLDARGRVNRTLCGLRFEGREAPPDGTELTAGARPAGRVTSAAYSPGFRAAVALGYVRRGHNGPGTRLESAAGPATVVPLPMREG